MQDRPDARELVEAVVSFLEREIIPTLSEPRLRFRALVAANVLTIVSRELASGDAALRQEWRRLAHLLGKTASEPPGRADELRNEVQALTRELCVRLRAGEADEEPLYGEAFAHAEETVIDKLRIANPRYLERVGEK
jgi:uncharacterized protein DUF6285